MRQTIAQRLRAAAKDVAEKREEFSCNAARNHGVRDRYNTFAPDVCFYVKDFEGDGRHSRRGARKMRVLMLLFAACFYDREIK